MKLFNTMTKQLEDVTKKQLDMFVCGPTVYDYIQLGNAKTFTQFDIIARAVRALGFELNYIQNITNIDDKIIKRAAEQKIKPEELANKFTEEFMDDMNWLNNVAASKFAIATDYIENIISQVETLLEKGYAYKTADGIYFEISKFKDYGKLSGRTELKEDDAQSRIDEDDNKKGWNDFALWKFSKEGEPVWSAPFGDGRPGWHIEDTAITEAEFGPQYDIHGGAVDLIFPHHEAEITQMEAASGKVPFVSTWLHAGFLTVTGRRMGKSLGNFTTVRQLREEGVDPNTLRLVFAQAHYRSQLDYSSDVLSAASSRWLRWRSMAALRWQPQNEGRLTAETIKESKAEILKHLANDIQTPEALHTIERVFSEAQEGLEKSVINAYSDFIEFIDDVLGLRLAESTADISEETKQIIEKRNKARESKDYAAADKLREKLARENIVLNDKNGATFWCFKD